MASFSEYEQDYERIWSSLAIRPEMAAQAHQQAKRLAAGKAQYLKVEGRSGVPWWFVGLCHYRESSFNFDTYLGNGQPLSRRTTIVPKDRGPFTGPDAFLNGCVDALRLEGFVGAHDWSIARVLYRLEGFNGYGYHGKGVNSPYLWGGSTAYGPPEARGGKYVRDHVFEAAAIDRQLGTAVILKALTDLDKSVVFGPATAEIDVSREADDEMAEDTLWLQQSLNRLGVNPPLAEDGKNGPRTMAAVSAFQARNGLNDTGRADAPTIAAIQRAMQSAAALVSDGAVAKRIDELERRLAAAGQRMSADKPVVESSRTIPVEREAETASADPVEAAVHRVLAKLGAGSPGGRPLDPTIRAIVDELKAKATSGPAPLGQVNGALGTTIGQLLDGKKTALGLIGATATQMLSAVPAGTGLGQVLGLLTPAMGLSPYTMPIFLALTAWGVLGKLEKWRRAAPPAGNP